jgi:hypothetical protein
VINETVFQNKRAGPTLGFMFDQVPMQHWLASVGGKLGTETPQNLDLTNMSQVEPGE